MEVEMEGGGEEVKEVKLAGRCRRGFGGGGRGRG